MADNAEALFSPELVFFDWECATPDEVFAQLEDELAPRGYIAEGWLDAVRTREDAYPTGLAMPICGQALYRGGKARCTCDVQRDGGYGRPGAGADYHQSGHCRAWRPGRGPASAYEYLYGCRRCSRCTRPDHAAGHGRRHPPPLLRPALGGCP